MYIWSFHITVVFVKNKSKKIRKNTKVQNVANLLIFGLLNANCTLTNYRSMIKNLPLVEYLNYICI